VIPMRPRISRRAVGPFPGSFRAISLVLRRFQADSSHAFAALVEDQPVKVIGQIAKREFRFGTGQTDRANEQPEPVLLMSKDMFDMGADRGIGGVGARSSSAWTWRQVAPIRRALTE
jgi:hypothetical protein